MAKSDKLGNYQTACYDDDDDKDISWSLMLLSAIAFPFVALFVTLDRWYRSGQK